MTKFLLTIAFTIGTLSAVVAQEDGIIRGRVIEDATGEAMIGVTCLITGTTTGAVTDFDGTFEIKVAEGIHDLQISFVSFETVNITGIEVKAGEVSFFDNIRLKESVQELGEITITAEIIRNSEEALLTVKKRSPSLMDVISAASFQKIGDSDASDAIKRVTGVSVEGGKYVYVRGLGDRYTKTVTNGMEIPGLDPDRNSLQIDIFPTNLLENLIVMKTATAEYPADFTGGLVNIETKDFPEEKIFSISAGFEFNPSMHFQNDYLKSEGSSTDWLGFDNGDRDLPPLADQPEVPTPINPNYTDQQVNDFVKSFNPELGPVQDQNFMNYSVGVSFGNQKTFKNGNNLGFMFLGTYKYTTEYFYDVIYVEYQRPGSHND